jgi:leader peptidase (prepilin peptidase)/N-methyltransferase
VTETTARILAFVLGALVGSFLNVCVSRWPQDQSVISPPSRCPKCGRPIRWYENVPIFGWLRLRGKCAGCREAISPMYPLV